MTTRTRNVKFYLTIKRTVNSSVNITIKRDTRTYKSKVPSLEIEKY